MPKKNSKGSDPPQQIALSGNRAKDGKFLPGHSLPGPGRLRGYDPVKAAVAACERNGTTLEHELGEVLFTLISLAKKGDVAAAREVLSRTTADMKWTASNDGKFTVTVVNTGVPTGNDQIEELLS